MLAVVVNGNAPLLIVVANVVFKGETPRATHNLHNNRLNNQPNLKKLALRSPSPIFFGKTELKRQQLKKARNGFFPAPHSFQMAGHCACKHRMLANGHVFKHNKKSKRGALFGKRHKIYLHGFWAQSYLCKPFFLAVSAKKRNFCGSAATFKGWIRSPLTENERKATRQSRGHSSLPCARSPRR